jgi:hypothetical protein
MIWSWTDCGDGGGEADGVGDAAADAEGAGDVAAEVAGDPEATGLGDAAGEPEAPGAAAGLDTGVGLGVATIGWPVTSDADEVRITTLATAAETNPMIRPTR